MRLDKFLCESTAMTRKEAKRALHREEVCVDGEVVKDSGFKIAPSMNVTLLGESLTVRGPRYIALHKPANYLCSTVSELYPSVLQLLDGDKLEDLHIAGRLDADTTGLVLITDDGQWSHKVTSPNKACEKRYRVWLADALDEAAFTHVAQQFANGVELRDEEQPTRPATLKRVSDNEVLLTITEGRYHQVKRMFAAVGNKVERLHRERVGAIELDSSLPEGTWRALTADEVASFR